MLTAVGNGMTTDIIVASAGVLGTAITALGREWFWLRALPPVWQLSSRVATVTVLQ
jgi:hypothetical protein